MTRDEIASRVRVTLNDEGVTYYSADDVHASIQDGYDEAVSVIQPFLKTKTITFVDSQVYYNLYTLISDYIRLVGIYNNNTDRWLDFTSLKGLQSKRIDWETTEGNPTEFIVPDFQWIAMWPRLSTAVGSMDIIYKPKGCTLDGNTELTLTNVDRLLLENYSVADLFEQSEEYSKAQRSLKDYFSELQSAKTVVEQRSLPDIVYKLRQQIPLREGR